MVVYNLIDIYLFLLLFAAIYWAVHVKAVNEKGYSTFILLLSCAIGIYLFGYAMELNANTAAQIIFWNRFEYLGIPFVSALWFTAALIYTDHFSRHKGWLILFIYLIPVVSMVLRLTNDTHHLYFAALNFSYNGDKLLLNRIYGPWMFVQTVHSLLLIVLTMGLFIQDLIKNHEQKSGKTGLIILASLAAAAGLTLSYLKPFGIILDYMALCLPVTCLSVVIAIWKYDFLKAKTLARSNAFESNRDALLLISEKNTIMDYNKTASQLFSRLKITLAAGDLDEMLAATPGFLESLKSHSDVTLKCEVDGTAHIYEISSRSIDSNHTATGWIKTICDVTEAYELNKRLKYQAMMDELSGLNNRRAFMQNCEKAMQDAMRRGEPLHLLMMDLDHFKHVNDRFGHLSGDQVITHTGMALKDHFDSNSLIARLGGEEFGVLLTGFSDEEIREKTQQFLIRFSEHRYHYQEQTFQVTLSIGVAKQKKLDQTLNELITMADKALYQAKDKGRNCVVEFGT